MILLRRSAVPATLLTALLALACAGKAGAERPFQKYWREKAKSDPQPTLVEDSASPLDPLAEKFLIGEGLAHSETYFPGSDQPVLGTEEARSIRSYASGALALESGNPYKALEGLREAVKKNPDSNYLKIRAAEIAISLNDLAVAEEMVKSILDSQPDNARALLRHADISVRRQRYPEAVRRYERALEASPGNIEALTMLARIALDIERNVERTRELALEILHVDDRNLQAILWYAETNAQLGDMDLAATYYRRLLSYRRDLIDRMLETARRLVGMDRQADAARLYEEALIADPATTAHRIQWERLLELQGPGAVAEGYGRLMEISGSDPEVANVFADYLARKNDINALRELRLSVVQGHPQHVESLLDLAAIALYEGDFPLAKSYHQRVVDTNPSDPETYLNIGQSWLAHAEVAGARDLFQTALLLDPENVRGLQLMARVEEWDGQPKNAELLLRRALEQSPGNAEVLRSLGGVYYRMEDHDRAEESFRTILAEAPKDSETWLLVARTRLERGDTAGFASVETEARAALGPSPAFLAELATLAGEYGDGASAVRLLTEAIDAEPAVLSHRAQLAQVQAWLDQPDQAVATLEAAKKHIAGNRGRLVEYEIRLATLLEELRRHDDAVAAWRRVIEQIPDELSYQERLIIALVKAGRRDEAERELGTVVAQFAQQRPTDVQLLRAQVLQRQGDPARAVRILADLRDADPANIEVHFRLANAAGEANDIDTAEQAYRHIIARGPTADNPYYAVSANNLAYLFAERDTRLDEAESLARIALDREPRSPIYLDTIGWIQYRQGRLEEARESLELAGRALFRDPEIFSHLGQLYERLGERDLAFTYYERALKADPTLDTIRERRDALAVRKNDRSDAER